MANRIDFAALGPNANLVPVILISGIPVVLVPAGVHPTTTAVTTGSLDTAWWPSTGTLLQTLPDSSTLDPVKGWLDPRQEFAIDAKANILEGDLEQGTLNFDLFDVSGEATLLLSGRDTYPGALLAADFDVGATDLYLQQDTGFPSSGIACIGRETVLYSSKSGTGTLTVATRGAFGSREVLHTYSPTRPAYVTSGGARWLFGRRVAFFLAQLSADGTTLTDPTLMFLGVVGRGIQLTENGTKWRIPADSILSVLTRKIDTRTVKPTGIAHYRGDASYIDVNTTPLAAVWADDDDPVLADYGVGLCANASAPHSGGWHDSWTTFLDAWNTRAATVNPVAAKASLLANGHLFVLGDGVTALYDEAYLNVWATWDQVAQGAGVRGNNNPSNSASSWTSRNPAPACFVPLDGKVKLSADDLANIPTTLTYSSADGLTNARWMLSLAGQEQQKYSVLNSDRNYVVASASPIVIAERDGVGNTITVVNMVWGSTAAPTVGIKPPILTSPTDLVLGLYVEGPRWDYALKLAATALDDLSGSDFHYDSVDWTSLGAVLDTVTPGGLPSGRRYTILGGTEDSFLAYLLTEVRMMGLGLCLKDGRISVYKPGDLADTEVSAVTVTATDLVGLPGVEDSPDGMVTSVKFTLPGGDTITHTDTSWRDQFGDGKTLEVAASRSVDIPDYTTLDGLFRSIAWSVITPLAQPYRVVTMVLPLPFLDVSTGDVLALTHPMVPGWNGTRGVTGALCQVMGVSYRLCGGRAQVKVSARLCDSSLVGYAPDGMVAAGGLTDGAKTVILSGTTVWGYYGFAQTGTGLGGASTFKAGDKVILVEADSLTPASQTGLEVDSVSGATVTLTSAVNATMAGLAVDPYKVLLKYADYDTTTTSQKAYAFIGDAATYTLGVGGNSPNRWG